MGAIGGRGGAGGGSGGGVGERFGEIGVRGELEGGEMAVERGRGAWMVSVVRGEAD